MFTDEPPRNEPILLSVVMIGFNELAGLESAVERFLTALEQLALSSELLIIDDGSTDGMGEMADELASRHPRVRALHNETNLNYGLSLARGIAAARGEWILHDPVDLPLAPEDLRLFLSELQANDLVIAQRRHRQAHSRWRQLTSIGNRILLGILFQPTARDLNFVQFYRRSFAQAVELVTSSPATVTPELILRAQKTGLSVSSVPCEFRARETGRPHFGRFKDISWTVRDLLRLRVWTWRKGWASS